MIGLCLKFHRARWIRTMLNKALFRVEEVEENKEEGKKKEEKHDFKHTPAS